MVYKWWLRNRIEIGISHNHRCTRTVSGAVCRRFESCQARFSAPDLPKVKTADLYAATAQPRKMLFTKSWTTPQNHTLEIRVLGTKNASSSGKRVDVDAFVALR
jgi:hypothetical protein